MWDVGGEVTWPKTKIPGPVGDTQNIRPFSLSDTNSNIS